jgi:hypothetical protein
VPRSSNPSDCQEETLKYEISPADRDALLGYRDSALSILADRGARVDNLILNYSDCEIGADGSYGGRWLCYRQVVNAAPEPQPVFEIGSASRDRFEYFDLELNHLKTTVSVNQEGFGTYQQTYDHCVQLSQPVPPGGTLHILAVALIGTEIWHEIASHRTFARLNTRNEWNGSIYCGGGIAQAYLWRWPTQTVIYGMTPQPEQVWVDSGRLCTFFVFIGSDDSADNVPYGMSFEFRVD